MTDSELASEIRGFKSSLNTALEEFQGVKPELRKLNHAVVCVRRDVHTLWKHVKGSPPPPPDDADGTSAYAETIGESPLVDRVDVATTTAAAAHDRASATSDEVAAFEGRLLAFEAQQKTLADQVKAAVCELREQSKAMGVGQSGLAFLASREGQKSIKSTVIAFVALVGAIASLVGACHGARADETISAPAAAVGSTVRR